jgi:hypothetical protein
MDSNKIVAVKVSITNLAPKFGGLVTPLWFAFHDGSFKTIKPEYPASSGIKYIAEEGFTGISLLIGDVYNDSVTRGLPIQKLPPYSETMGGIFSASPAGLNGGVQGLLTPNPVSPRAPGFFPGDFNSTARNLSGDLTLYRYFSYAAMVIPSNDGFISSEEPIEIFDCDGKFIGADFIVHGSEVWDAGTETNDENPANVPFKLSDFGKGEPENDVVRIHPGLRPAGTGGLLDFNPTFAKADFKSPGYQVARIVISEL